MFDLKWLDKIRKYVELARMPPIFGNCQKSNNIQIKKMQDLESSFLDYSPEFMMYISVLYNLPRGSITTYNCWL